MLTNFCSVLFRCLFFTLIDTYYCDEKKVRRGKKKITKGALARVNPYDFGGRKCFFFFVKKQDCLIRGSPLIFVLHGFNSQIMPKNH